MIRENVVAREIVAAAYRVHETLGPGLLESVYEAALAYELANANLPLRRQHPIPVRYNDVLLATGFRADLLVDGSHRVGEDGAFEVPLEAYGMRWLRVVHEGERRLV